MLFTVFRQPSPTPQPMLATLSVTALDSAVGPTGTMLTAYPPGRRSAERASIDANQVPSHDEVPR
jgi:hypothetical protein